MLTTVPLVGTLQDPGSEARTVEIAGSERELVLEPADPRSEELAIADPSAADGLFEAETEDGRIQLHLVHTASRSLGLLSTPTELRWVTLDGRQLVPVTPGTPGTGSSQGSLGGDAVDGGPSSSATSAEGTVDRTVQIRLDGDLEYFSATRSDWDDHQLRVMHLVGAIYDHHFGVDFEVVDQEVTTFGEDARFTSGTLCEPGGLLREYTDHLEQQAPTTDNARELSHLFSGKSFPDHIGCAWIRELNTDLAYGVSESVGLGSLHRDVRLVAHEIGHNFDGLHGRATPTPGGQADLAAQADLFRCKQPASLMYPCLTSTVPVFSNATGPERGLSDAQGVAEDGGNVPHMRAYAIGRI